MSWTRTIPPPEATGALKRLYAAMADRSAHRRVSNLWQTMAADPRALEGAFAHLRALLDDPAPLSRTQAEMIAVVVSATNGCAYCVAHHSARLARVTGDERLARQVARDYRAADLSARDRVLLDAAVALTCECEERREEDIERLREYGFDDTAIVRALSIAAYFAFANRMALALGVRLEDDMAGWGTAASI
jgi:uncharacterized peroxidase-related enzyme